MKRFLLAFSILLVLTTRIAQAHTPHLHQRVDSLAMHHWVDSVFDSMSLEERIGQLFVLGVETNLSAQNKALLKKYVESYKIGGVLFSKGTATQQAELTNLAQEAAKVPLLVTHDGEWGLAMRLTDTPRFPYNIALGAVTNDSLIYAYGREVGRECQRMGIHVNFAPVLDVNSNAANPVIGFRSFGESPQRVAQKAIAYAKGLESMGVMAVAKHFPGHGDTSEDSHFTLPLVAHNRAELDSLELYPFRQYIAAGLSGMMAGHLHVPALDSLSGLPSSQSAAILDTLLRQELGFEGLLFTDAMEMKGSSTQDKSATHSLLAGNDILLKPSLPLSQINQIKEGIEQGTIPMQVVEDRCLHILRYKYILGLSQSKPVEIEGLESDINRREAELLIRRLTAESITLLGDTTRSIPLKQLNRRSIAVVSVGSEERVTLFQETMQKYGYMECYSVSRKSTDQQVQLVKKNIQDNNTLIVALHSSHASNVDLARRICAEYNAILVCFTTPYILAQMERAVSQAQALLIAYENTSIAQEYAAQALMGGIGCKGKLPVTINNRYREGMGLFTHPTRLGYSLPEEVGMCSDSLLLIDSIVASGIKKEAFPGCQIVIARHGKVIYEKAFGHFDYAGTHPVTNRDIYDIASVTKAVGTLPMVMKLYDQNKLGLSRKLSTFVPELAETDKSEITVVEALYHETGMPSSLIVPHVLCDTAAIKGKLYSGRRDANYRIQVDRNYYAHKGLQLRKELFSTERSDLYTLPFAENLYAIHSLPDTLIARIASAELRDNKEYRYSCLNFVLLKEAAEHVAAQNIDSYLAQHFFRPLGANHIQYNPLQRTPRTQIAPTENDALLRKQIIIGYPHDELAAMAGGVGGNAGLFSNANDLAKILQLYLNLGEYGGERYLSERTTELFTTAKSENSRRGLGFDKPYLEDIKKSPTCAEAPATVYGHTGYTGTCFWVDPTNDIIYIFLTNRIYPNRWNTELYKRNIRTEIQSIIYRSIDNPTLFEVE